MMEPVHRVDDAGANADRGRPALDAAKISWTGGLICLSVIFVPYHLSLSGVIVLLTLTYFTMLFGHSVGMHRMMIHRTFKCPKPVERLLIYIGVLVGMGGPSNIIRIHDLRDWAQRQSSCHDYFAHKQSFLRDLTWQLFYRFEFDLPPKINIEDNIKDDKWILFFDKTWWAHQFLLAGILFACGGFTWVVWGVIVRVPLSIISHWTVTYFCHNPGQRKYEVEGAYVQASNLPMLGFLSHGECWHNNHHAFPESAKIGLDKGQTDPAWWVIRFLDKVGIAFDVRLPRPVLQQEDLKTLSS